MVAEDYIHRIGRTGRAGAQGTAISLVNKDDRSKLRDIERLTGQSIKFEIVVGLEPRETPQIMRFSTKTPRKPFHGKRKKKGKAPNQPKSSDYRQHAKGSGRTTAHIV
jgi:ATP-dependent RNA helicase RhlE